ncbi:MAG: hypothetical protein ACI840_001496 [Ulvibacter sp.]
MLFTKRKLFGGLDFGLGVNIYSDAKTGFYARPKAEFNLNKITLIVSLQIILGG